MLKLRSLKLYGLVLSLLLVFQTALACYDGHGELDTAVQHLPAGHQDAADGTPHLDHPQHSEHSLQEQQGLALIQLEPADHTGQDIAQDCNHCCHCHSSISLCLPVNVYSSASCSGHLWSAAADSGFPHGFISSLYRPPIT
ncbi:hypothetical protein [Microbulbifer pacificus]|uniref:hypothetical protein n=1 Tax=Microbulbifer pacificus TaxID=407164 RepID=UPI00131A282E|nr:hypothetical protein [Microbulbifer pacificus]